MAVPYTFGSATSAIPLSQLDSNFATTITLGNTAIQLGNTVTTLNNMTLANVTISSGNVTITNVSVTTANVTTLNAATVIATTGNITTVNATTVVATTANATTANITTGNLTDLNLTNNPTFSGGTANGVLYLNASKVATSGSALTFDGTTLQLTNSNISERSSTTAVNGTVLGKYSFSGYDGGAYTEAAKIESQSQSSWAVVSREAGLYFSTLYNSSLGVRYQINNDGTSIWSVGGSEQMRLTSKGLLVGYTSDASLSSTGNAIFSGSVGIGTSSPAAGASSTKSVDASGPILTGGAINANQTNKGVFQYINNETTIRSYGATAGTGQIVFKVAGGGGSADTEAARIDSSGNLGLGVAPSAWVSFKAIDVNTISSFASATNRLQVAYNSFWNGSNYIYKTTAEAARYDMISGQHQWFTAPSGTAGNAISFTQAATLDDSGNFLVGSTSTSGSISNVTTNVGGIFKTASGTVSTANATATTLTTLLNQGQAVYLITAGISAAGSPTLYSTVAIVSTQGTATNLTTIQTGTNVVLSMSGLDVKVTQTAGATYSISWTAIRLA